MTTANLQVAASLDDAYERKDNSVESNTATFINAAASLTDGQRRAFGVRFTGPDALPGQGDTITSATFEGTPTSASFDDALYDLYAEDADAPANFSTINLWARTLTTASVSVVGQALGTGWHAVTTGLETVIQEVVDRPGYAGTSIVLLGLGKLQAANNVGDTRYVSYDLSTSLCCKLTIVYTAAAAPAAPSNGLLLPGGRTL